MSDAPQATLLVPGGAELTLRQLASGMGAEQDFLAAQPVPVVLVPRIALPAEPPDMSESADIEADDTANAPNSLTPGVGFNTIHGNISPLPYVLENFAEAIVAPLVKTSRNTFAQMITIGRALNNDIAIPIATLSKLHGYFMKGADGTFRYYDAGSTNGSWVVGERVKARTSVTIQDGSELVLGPDVRLLFKTPAGLFDMARLIKAKLGGGASAT